MIKTAGSNWGQLISTKNLVIVNLFFLGDKIADKFVCSNNKSFNTVGPVGIFVIFYEMILSRYDIINSFLNEMIRSGASFEFMWWFDQYLIHQNGTT